MKVKIYDASGSEKGDMELPSVFNTRFKPLVISRAVTAVQRAKRQPYGANVLAGKRTSAHYHGKRGYRYSMMNKETARIARIHGNVGYLNFTARLVCQAVKGRKAHPPKADKKWVIKINNKEMKLALMSALAACSDIEKVKARGHVVEMAPIVFDDSFEKIEKTKEVSDLLVKVGLGKELERAKIKKVRAGRGKVRGRKYKRKKGPLVIVNDCPALKSVRNIAGVDVCTPDNVDIELLAPGADVGRILIMSKSAVDALEKMFVDTEVKKNGVKVQEKKGE